jgi:hypothetical protein
LISRSPPRIGTKSMMPPKKEMPKEPKNSSGSLPRKPTAYDYSMVLNAWSKDQSAEAPQRAEQILATMWEKFESGELDAKPDVVSYSSVINCWAKSRQHGAADWAEATFREMQDRYKAGDEA